MRFLFLIPLCVTFIEAATLYCGPAATGSGSGADFNNRLALPNTTGFTRGDTYIIIEGSYGGKTLSTATSGTTTITIKYASAADSGVAGYASTLHDGQATFGGVTVVTRYWIMDGVSRTEPNAWAAPAGYGFQATAIIANSNNDDDADFSQFRYMDIGETYNEAPSAATIAGYGQPIYMVGQTDVTFSRCAVHNGKGTLVQGASSQNLIFEYCHFGPGWGKEAIRGGNGGVTSGWKIRFNRFWQSSQTDPNDVTSGITAEIGIWDWAGTATGIEIYGNWFFNDKSGGRNSWVVVGGDGGGWAGGGADGTLVYNNSLAGAPENSVFTEIDLNGSSTVARNNLAWDTLGAFDVSASTTSNNTDASSNPFLDYAGHDFRLAAATAGGFSLSSPHNTDPTGATRGADGVWDVGAYEFAESGAASTRKGHSIIRRGGGGGPF